MPRALFPPPWDPTPETWEHAGLTAKLSLPGLAADCATPKQGAAPVTHRFLDIFLRRDLEMPLPEMPSANAAQLYMRLLGESNQATDLALCDPLEDFCIRSWQVRRPIFAMAVTSEQAWQWLGTTLGELAEAISLTPGEELEVQVYTWDRTKLSEDMQTTDLVDRKTESSLTVHASAQVVNRMEEQTEWQLGANVGFSYGVTAGIEASYGESMTESMERRREERQEQTRKTAQQVRSERQLKIATSRETGIEERRKRVLKNENPTRTVTYNFYETVAHYRVDLAIVETQTAVALPNRLPRITPDWVVCNDGILREVLLDQTQEEGFDAARELKRGSDLERDIVAAAARRLKGAFEGRRTSAQDLEPEEVIPPPSFGGAFVRALLGGLTLGASEVAFGTADLVTYLEEQPSDNREERPSGAEIEEFLVGVVESPSLNGLLVGLKLVADYHAPWYVGRYGRYDRYQCYPMTELVDRAIGYGKAAALAMSAAAPPEITSGEGEGEEADAVAQAAKANQAAWLEWKAEQADRYRALRDARAKFDALACHLEHNLLHYMRPIWVAEDPALRLKRHARELGLGETELKQFVRQPLLGFHVNCCIYPCEPPAFEAMVPMMSHAARDLRQHIEMGLRARAIKRFEHDAQKVLSESVDRAVHQLTSCATKDAPLTIAALPQVLDEASERIKTLHKDVEQGDGWQRYVSRAETVAKVQAETRITVLEATTKEAESALGEGRLAEIEQARVSAGDLARELNARRDFKSIMVALPDGGYHCEPVVGTCSAAEELRQRRLDAESRVAEAEADRLRKRVEELPASELSSGGGLPTINVRVTDEED